MENKRRPDLSEQNILVLALVIAIAAGIILLSPGLPSPGSAGGQISAAIGAMLFLAPLLFLVMKRSGLSASPPAWFVTHVVATMLGSCFIFFHAASGNWLTPPGIVLLLMILLIVQGSLLRSIISRGFSLLFARNSQPLGFQAPPELDKAELQRVIDAKQELLCRIDPGATEALFSPALKHWLRRPWLSFCYQRLARDEARQVGARRGAGIELGWSRRIHMLAALLFYLGLLAHIVVVLFFAGYAAGGETIDWWYITDWGKP